MAEQATEKQINFANNLGIENPSQFSKQALKEMIDKKLKERDAGKAKVSQASMEITKHDVVINRTEKPNSYEFGKAGNRFKVYYENVEDLKAHIKMLEDAGLLDNEIETQKI